MLMRKKYFLISLLFVFLPTWVVLFFYALNEYQESKMMYTAFSLIYLAVLVRAIYRPIAYSYLFLSLFVFLGFWMKLTLHLIFNYDYIEDTGQFFPISASMDNVLIVAIIGAVSFLSVDILYRAFKIKTTICIRQNDVKPFALFSWYTKYQNSIIISLIFFLIILGYLNVYYGIQVSGLVPQTILFYPMNALIYWMLGIGFSLILATFITWEVRFSSTINVKILIVFSITVAISSISILSRGQYIFLVGSMIVYLLFNLEHLKNMNMSKIIFYSVFSLLVYFLIVSSVSMLRDHYYYAIEIKSGLDVSGLDVKLQMIINTTLSLISDRWIGMEGLMSVCSYPDKSFDLFWDALTTIPKIGDIDIYQYISNSHYKDMDNTKYVFSTLPGMIAFLYYTDSMIFVFFGSVFIISLMILIEYSIRFWLKSTLYASIVGVYLANFVAQMGTMPLNFIKFLILLFIFFVFVKFIESPYLMKLITRFRVGFK